MELCRHSQLHCPDPDPHPTEACRQGPAAGVALLVLRGTGCACPMCSGALTSLLEAGTAALSPLSPSFLWLPCLVLELSGGMLGHFPSFHLFRFPLFDGKRNCRYNSQGYWNIQAFLLIGDMPSGSPDTYLGYAGQVYETCNLGQAAQLLYPTGLHVSQLSAFHRAAHHRELFKLL